MMRLFSYSLFFLLCISVNADVLTPEDFAQGIVLEAEEGAPIYEFELNEEVYTNVVRHDLGDIRVFNANDEVVAHVLQKNRETTVHESQVKLPIFPLYPQSKDYQLAEDGTILEVTKYADKVVLSDAPLRQYIIDSGTLSKKGINALQFEFADNATASKNYLQKLKLEQSRDLNKWRRLLNSATLTRLEFGGHLVEQNRISLPTHHERYWRLTWLGEEDTPQLRHVFAVLRDLESPTRLEHSTKNGVQTGNTPIIYEFDSGGAFPIERVNLVLAEENTLLQASLSSRASKEEKWLRRHNGAFYRLRVKGHLLENESVRISPTDDRYWQLKVEPGNGLGTKVPRFSFSWTGDKLLFLARGPGPFTLAFGSGKSIQTDTQNAALLKLLSNKQVGLIAKARYTGKVTLSGSPAKDRHFDISWQRGVLWLVLGGGVLILGFMAFRLLRQMNK